ncbi:MAG: PBP1A family penicillin-binding protein [Fibrobacter sp.]|nr:PBP1A family penicillin-binding protein [Fibrobacter sp.]
MNAFQKIVSAVGKVFPRPGKKVFIWLGIFLVPCIAAFVAIYMYFASLVPTLPSLQQLEDIDPKLVTTVYDKDSIPVHEFFVERRVWTPIDSIPQMQMNAVMATEDRDFYTHWGMNIVAIPKAVIQSVTRGDKIRGASTLTQQLSKLLFLTPERKLSRKIKEAMTSVRIEQTYTKREIMEFYMNEVYLGGGNYGFQAASDFYFGKPLDSISIPQMAILAGMLQRPEGYRPDRHPEAAFERRNTVLYAMQAAGYISKEDYKRYIEEPVETVKHKVGNGSGLYYYEEIRKFMENKYGQKSLYADGVNIYSTIDPNIQAFAEEVEKKHIARIRKRIQQRAVWKLGLSSKYNMPADSVVAHFDSVYALFKKEYLAKDTASDPSKWRYPDSSRYHAPQMAMILIENGTGAIRAMVGGNSFTESRWNRAVQSLRQPGSSFKPIVYATAVEAGASPCDSINDQPVTIEDEGDPSKTWRPANFEKEFEGMMTMRRALYRSMNLPAVLTGIKYGLSNVVDYARKFGIKKAPLQPVPSLALGSIGSTLMEMTSAYTVFPNGGVRIEPYMIDSIVDQAGNVIERHKSEEKTVLKPASAYIMVDMLKDVNIHGTGARVGASGFRHPSGGKTGTTNNYADAWYIGFTRYYTMGVWVGTDSPAPMGPGHTGSEDPLPAWIEVMKELHKDLPIRGFSMPAGVVAKKICNHTGKIAGEFCGATSYCLYSAGHVPEEYCDGNHLSTKKDAGDATIFSSKSTAEGSMKAKTKKEKDAPPPKKKTRQMF